MAQARNTLPVIIAGLRDTSTYHLCAILLYQSATPLLTTIKHLVVHTNKSAPTQLHKNTIDNLFKSLRILVLQSIEGLIYNLPQSLPQ